MTEELTTSTAVITTQEFNDCHTTMARTALLHSKGIPMLDGGFHPDYNVTFDMDKPSSSIFYSWEVAQ